MASAVGTPSLATGPQLPVSRLTMADMAQAAQAAQAAQRLTLQAQPWANSRVRGSSALAKEMHSA